MDDPLQPLRGGVRPTALAVSPAEFLETSIRDAEAVRYLVYDRRGEGSNRSFVGTGEVMGQQKILALSGMATP